MSARKDAEAQKDAKLAEELEEARQAQKELDRREKDDADSQDKAKKTVAEKAETRENDDTSAPGGGNGPAPANEATQNGSEKTANSVASELLQNRQQPQPQSQMLRRKRPEEHTSELQSLMRNSYAVFCLK